MERTPVIPAQPRLETFTAAPSLGHKNVDNTPPSSPTDVSPERKTLDVAANSEVTIGIAEEVALTMGIPENVIKMTQFLQLLKHGHNFSDALQLYAAAENLLKCPEEADRIKKLYEQTEKERKIKDKVDSKDNNAFATSRVSVCETRELKVKETPVESKPSLDDKAQLKEKVKRLAQENHRLRQRKTCRACMKVDLASSGVTYLPCGHFITCEACSEKFDDCPACGKSIMGTVRTFLS